MVRISLSLYLLTSIYVEASDKAYVSEYNLRGSIAINSWKTIRDEGIVKQNLDYSCGAASLATVLNEQYALSVTEEEILKIMNKGDMRASFNDMANALTELGFRGVGYAASYEQLTKLKIPVIVYTKHRKDDHFSVLRGINQNTVWLADPTLGNRTYSRHQFLKVWETREDLQLKGKILAIIPISQEIQSTNEFFTNHPRRQTAQAAQQQMFRSPP